jgi:dolichol-phosphate mannosyltransferase
MPEEPKRRFSIIIPVLNEKKNLENLLPKLNAYRLIIIDDGSTDGTPELCLGKDNVLFIERGKKMGLVSAVLEGFRNLSSDDRYIVTIDSDSSHDPESIDSMIRYAESRKLDLLIGSRYVKGGSSEDSISRKLMSKSANILFRLAFSSRIRDATSGYRVYSRELADFIVSDNKIQAVSPSYAGQVDILRRALSANFIIEEFPIRFRKRGEGNSKLRTGDIFQYLSLVSRKGYLMRYVLVGISGVIVNEMLLKAFLGLIGNASEVIAVEASVISNFVLNDKITFRTTGNGSGKYFLRMLKYNVFNLGGVGINIAIFLTLINFSFNPLIANLFGIIVAFAFTYLTSISIVWRR